MWHRVLSRKRQRAHKKRITNLVCEFIIISGIQVWFLPFYSTIFDLKYSDTIIIFICLLSLRASKFCGYSRTLVSRIAFEFVKYWMWFFYYIIISVLKFISLVLVYHYWIPRLQNLPFLRLSHWKCSALSTICKSRSISSCNPSSWTSFFFSN